jgi:hypothetical protein
MEPIVPANCKRLDVPEELPEWDYDESVRFIKPRLYKWKNMTAEILLELWVARETLSQNAASQPRNTAGTFVPTDKTWDDYCEEIGIEKRTANRWLQRALEGDQDQLPGAARDPKVKRLTSARRRELLDMFDAVLKRLQVPNNISVPVTIIRNELRLAIEKLREITPIK